MKLSKSKIIGLIALLAVVGVVCGTLVWRQSQPAPAEPTEQVSITGYLGGEKIGLFDDAKFKALAAKQGIAIDYRKAGSPAMMDTDRKGMGYLFPSSRAAVEYGNAKGVKAPQSDIVFNSPIVLYTHKAVADGLVNGGLVTKDDSGAYHMDMAKAVDAMVANTTWPTSDTRQATNTRRFLPRCSTAGSRPWSIRWRATARPSPPSSPNPAGWRPLPRIRSTSS